MPRLPGASCTRQFFDIDVNEYEVTGYSCNAWDVSTKTGKKTNYQVKLTLKPRAEELDYQEVKKQLDYAISKVNIKKIPGVNTGVVCLADLHIGADIRNLQRTPDFNFKSVIQYLKDIANQVNQRGYEKVEVIFLGDFIESFTGLNHVNSWKSMGKGLYGHHVVILAFEIMREFIKNINNLKSVYMVSGNHDRSTSDAKVDNEGDVAGLLAYMLRSSLDKVNVEFSKLAKVMIKDIDNSVVVDDPIVNNTSKTTPKNLTHYEMLKRLELDKEQFYKIFNYCKKLKIKF